MRWPSYLLTTALLLGAAAGVSLAGGSPAFQASADIIAKYDTDHDGVLSDAEKVVMKAAMEADRHALIAKYDANGDGALDEAERAAMQAALNAARLAEQTAKFAAMDVDGSGDLSVAEFDAGAPANASPERIQAAFTRMDTDGDGVISLAEFTAHLTPPPAADKSHKGNGANKRNSRASVAMAW